MRRPILVFAALAVAPVVALTLLSVKGGLAAVILPGLSEPGPVTRIGLPATQGLRDVTAALTLGLLVLAAFLLPPDDSKRGEDLEGARRRVVDAALLSAVAWTTSSLLLLAFTYSDVSGTRLTATGFVEQAWFFGRKYELGQYQLAAAAIVALLAFGCAVVRTAAGLGFLVVLAVAALWATALGGHTAGTLNHGPSVNLQFFHLVGVSVWLGGLLALILMRRWLGTHFSVCVRRYAVLAGCCLALVSVSGVVGAVLRLGEPAGVWSMYGAMLGLKSGAVLAVTVLAAWQRRRLLGRLEAAADHVFARLAVIEVIVLASAAGTGVALSRTSPPRPPEDPEVLTTNQSLLGADMPPALGASEWFTQWSIDALWLPIAVFLLAWYLLGVRRLRRRGDSWPLIRTISWATGWLLFIWATNGSPGAYGRSLFSMHMVQHMTIATAVPTFLVLGAPVTLALRTLRRRTDGSAGPREWIQRLVLSLPVQILGTPIVAAALFIISLVAFYYSSLLQLSLESHTAHVLMVAHFLLTGYLFANALVGIDPGTHRPAYPLRALLLMVTFGFHALFSVSLMASTTVLAPGWYGALERSWGTSLIEDQALGASIGWALGDYPLAIMAGALIVLWVQSDRRERRRFDRREDRGGDQELNEYNDYLRSLAESGRPRILD